MTETIFATFGAVVASITLFFYISDKVESWVDKYKSRRLNKECYWRWHEFLIIHEYMSSTFPILSDIKDRIIQKEPVVDIDTFRRIMREKYRGGADA